MIISNCCNALSIGELHENLGFCSKCNEHAVFFNEEEIDADFAKMESEFKLSNFLRNGGLELGYDKEEYPDPADFEDVLMNEIQIEKYKQLTNQ